jgi:hypothetical protein
VHNYARRRVGVRESGQWPFVVLQNQRFLVLQFLPTCLRLRLEEQLLMSTECSLLKYIRERYDDTYEGRGKVARGG